MTTATGRATGAAHRSTESRKRREAHQRAPAVCHPDGAATITRTAARAGQNGKGMVP